MLRIERSVCDLARSVAFYVGALGFVADAWRGQAAQAVLHRGRETLVLQEGGETQHLLACDQGFQHIALPVSTMAEAMARLQAFAPRMISIAGAQVLPASSGGVTALKFRDPDGHPVEFLQFPGGNSAGIDHSAIVVADVERSLAFYGGELGLRVVARQVNAGPAQDRLDGLRDVEVDVVALTAAQGTPHLELLGYRTPAVLKRRPDAVAATRLVFEVEGAGAAEAMCDPDGHALMFMRQR